MMAQSRAESTRDTYNYGQYINQFPPNTIKAIREYERIQKKICRHKMSIMFNEICNNEEMLPKYTYIYTYIYIYFFIIQRVKARVIPCPHQLPTRGDNTVSVAQGGTATPGATKQLLPPDRVLRELHIYIDIYIYIYIHQIN